MQILVLEINTSITLFNLSNKDGSLKFENLGEIQDLKQLNYSDNTNCLIIDSTSPEEPKLSMLLTNFINSDYKIINLYQLVTPLFYEDLSGWSLVYGQAIMSILIESMNTNNYEQIYFYGVKSYGANKEMTVGRVTVANLISFDQWEFWNGNDWTPDIVQSHSIGSNISQEFSVSEIDANSYIAVDQLNTISTYTAFS